jgi:type I restriction enzyme S subunit
LGWCEKRLGEAVTLKRGYDLPASQRVPGNVPVVSSSGVTGTHNEAKAKAPGVVTGRYGTLGEVFYMADDFWPLNTALYVEDFKGNHPRFISYFLKQALGGTSSDKAAVPGVNRNDLHARRVLLPDLALQAKIADCLSAYDDLIENNRRRIQLLEQSARLLYKEWFVRLRFPGHERVKIKNGVPVGWERKTVNELTSYLNRGITPKYDDNSTCIVINQKCIRERLINLELARRQSKDVAQEKKVKFGDVLVNSTGEGTLGRVAQITFDLENCTVDSHITIVRSAKGVPVYYFGLCLTSLESFFSTMGRGATNQTELSRSTIGEIRILVPASDIAGVFESLVDPIYQQINMLNLQNKKLTAARDLLLPRLMNGEIAL